MARALRKFSSRTPLTAPRKSTVAEVLDKGWTVRRAAGLYTLTADALSALPWLVHGFSTRLLTTQMGHGQLNSARVLNFGFTERDSRKNVTENRLRFLRSLDAEQSPLINLHQIHSDVIRVVVTADANRPQKGDASITRLAGVILAVQTADCVPIFLVDRVKRVVAAVHAGWRGTLARITEKTLGRMRVEFGTLPRDTIAVLGPAIGRCCYEMGPEIAKDFAGQFDAAADWFDGPFERLAGGDEPNPLPWLNMMPPGHQPAPERVQLDLRAANRWQLVSAGVPAKNITVSSLCTACRTDLLFSYRREGPQSGRMMAAIGIKGAGPHKNSTGSKTRSKKSR